MQSELFEKKERKKRTPAPNIYNEFLWYFKNHWEKKYRGRSFDVTGKQYGQAQHLLKPVPGFPLITKEETFRRVDRFLSNQHFNVCSHAFHKLIQHWDMFTETIAAENKPKRETIEDPVITFVCTNCRHSMMWKRSRWLQYKNKSGYCSKCGKSFNVNDVLNQIPTINKYLPKGQQ